MLNNTIYRSQLAALTFFMVFAFKIVMLPKYLAMGTHDYLIGIAIAEMIELTIFAIVYHVIYNVNIPYMYANIWVKRILCIGIIISSATRLVVLSVETLDYISSLLFQEGRWLFIILTLFPALCFIAYKGTNTIARLSEIMIWAVLLALIFMLVFLKADMDIDNMLPILDDGTLNVTSTLANHSLWFGDFVPFLLLDVKDKKRGLDKVAPPIGLVVTYVVIVGFYGIFLAIYGEVSPYIKYAFSNVAIYNSISNVLGGVDFPIVCVWVLMAIIKLSFLLFSICYSMEICVGKEVSKKARVGINVVVTLAVMLVLSFATQGVHEVYIFATSYIHYVILAIDLSIVLIMVLINIMSKRKTGNMSKSRHIYDS